jgi:hypothetical protein
MSKKSSGSSLETVASLLAERQKFEQWIATLEARRASTPESVYARVRADYSSRLDRVTAQLQEHAGELAIQAEKLAGRLAELSTTEQERREERAEAELRAHVGELTADEWQATARQADDGLAALAAEQAVVAADLNRVHELLGAAAGPPEPPPPASPEPAHEEAPDSKKAPVALEAPRAEPAHAAASPAPAPVPPSRREPGVASQGAPVSAPPASPPAPAVKTPARASRFDELAFLKSVVSPVANPPVKPRDDHARAGVSKPDDQIIAEPDVSADATNLVSRANRPSVEREFIRDDESAGAAGLAPKAKEPRRSTERPFAANVTGNHPIVLRPSGAIEQPKTLKCGECGAMNYPTEWYCERCGAELASL